MCNFGCLMNKHTASCTASATHTHSCRHVVKHCKSHTHIIPTSDDVTLWWWWCGAVWFKWGQLIYTTLPANVCCWSEIWYARIAAASGPKEMCLVFSLSKTSAPSRLWSIFAVVCGCATIALVQRHTPTHKNSANDYCNNIFCSPCKIQFRLHHEPRTESRKTSRTRNTMHHK